MNSSQVEEQVLNEHKAHEEQPASATMKSMTKDDDFSSQLNTKHRRGHSNPFKKPIIEVFQDQSRDFWAPTPEY